MGTGDPTAWSQVIVNLFKAGDTARELQGITLVSICRKMFTNMLRKRMESKCTCTRLRRRSEAKDPAQTTCSCSRASSANKTVYAFFWTRAYDTVWRDGLSAKLLEKGVDGKLWRVLRDLAVKSTSQVRVNGDLSAFPLSAGVGQGDPSTLLFDIFIDLVAGLHDTCSEHGICMGQTDVASCYMRTMRMHYPSPQWLAKLIHPHLAQQMADAR
jgi:hypothetical protein